MVIDSSGGLRIGIRMSTMCTSSEMQTQRMNLREGARSHRARLYRRRRMITLPATDTAMPTHVSGCQWKPSNAAETTSATMGTMTPV